MASETKVVPWDQRPHPGWCGVYDPAARCTCVSHRQQAEIHELRVLLASTPPETTEDDDDGR